MGCNCKAKQKIRTTKRYFDIETNKKEREHLTAWGVFQMSFFMLLSIVFLPIVLLTVIFNRGKTIRLDKFLVKKKK